MPSLLSDRDTAPECEDRGIASFVAASEQWRLSNPVLQRRLGNPALQRRLGNPAL